MSKFNRFLRFLRDFKKASGFPRIANYEITSRCNLNCEHCYWRRSLNSSDELSDDQWRAVFTEHKSRGVTLAFLTGGEPSLRLNVIDMADRIFNGLAIASNGVIKIPDHINRRIFISIDGPDEVHNRIRGVDVFDQVLSNITDDKRVILSPTISMTNYRRIDELIAIARETNVEGITFSLYTSLMQENDPLLLYGRELQWTIAKLWKSWKKNKDIVFMTPYIINLFEEKEHHRDCFFRGKNFISFDARLHKKTPCVLGESINCSTCGCIVPMVSYALKKIDIRSWFLLNRMFPEKFFRISE
jgi:MoaA/NifB/PqqE/SkfB family radical SAM enzyme